MLEAIGGDSISYIYGETLKMTVGKNYIVLVLFFFCTMTPFAQNKLAVINDPDGFTNVRSGPNKDFSIIDTLHKDDFFYFNFEGNSEWVKVTAYTGRQIDGFIHKSKIQSVENLDIKKQKQLITQILDQERILADKFQKAWQSKDSFAYRKAVRELESYSDIKYDPVLDFLPVYVCKTNDTEVLQLFFATLWADKGSANEMPSFSIGKCFVCKTDLIIEQIKRIKHKEQKKLIYDHIEWGLLNHFDIDKNGKAGKQEFNMLKARLDAERKKTGL